MSGKGIESLKKDEVEQAQLWRKETKKGQLLFRQVFSSVLVTVIGDGLDQPIHQSYRASINRTGSIMQKLMKDAVLYGERFFGDNFEITFSDFIDRRIGYLTDSILSPISNINYNPRVIMEINMRLKDLGNPTIYKYYNNDDFIDIGRSKINYISIASLPIPFKEAQY